MSLIENRFLCPHCRQKLACEDGYAGWRIQCPACQGAVIVPLSPVAPASRSATGRPSYPASDVPPARAAKMRTIVKWCQNLAIALVVVFALLGILNGAFHGRAASFDRAFALGFWNLLWVLPILLIVSGTANLIGMIPAENNVARHLAVLAVGTIGFSLAARLVVEGLPRSPELTEQVFWFKQLGYGLAFFLFALVIANQFTPSLIGQVVGGLLGPVLTVVLGWSLLGGLEAGCEFACGGGLGPPSKIPKDVHLHRFFLALLGLLGSTALFLFLFAWLKSIRSR